MWDNLDGSRPKSDTRRLVEVVRDMERRIRGLESSSAPSAPTRLPAQTPTEDQIVAALKADPAMAGRVIVLVAREFGDLDRESMNAAASERANDFGAASIAALKFFAVALAAASYRG